jgi:hypothetical protein
MPTHRTWTALRITLVLALPALLAGCAMFPGARAADVDRQIARAATALARGADADSLAAAGLLGFAKSRDQSLALMARATAVAPDRADLLWLQLASCNDAPPCDPQPLEQRLRALDPANGAAWLGALARANAANNDEARDAALAAIGRSDRVDIYWTTLIARLSRATAQTKVMSLPTAEAAVIGVMGAETIPAYGVASNAFKGDRLQRAEVNETCRGLAKALQRGDTYITELIGVAVAKRVWPEHSPEWTAATDARRLYEYRAKLWGKFETIPWTASTAESFLTLCTQNRREQDVLLAQLVATGANPNPPAQ